MTLVALHIDWHRVAALSIAALSDGLPDARVRRIAGFLRKEDQCRCAFAGHLIDFLYRRAHPDLPSPALTEGPHGKPEFVDPDAPAFNISHSGDWVVGVSGAGPLGVDVERIKPDTTVLGDVLSPAERQELETMPAPRRAAHFIKLWTLKEACLKARGLGFSAGMPVHLSFRVDEEGMATLAGNTGPLVYRSFMLDAAHALATCTPPPGPTAPLVIEATDILTA